MDPTTIPPPSPEKSPPPPPQNPHTPTAIIDAPAFDCYQKAEPSTKGNMDNFKALVSKLAGRLLPAHQSLIERRLDDMIPDELLAPNHPPYADMILTAIWELNTNGGCGSNEEAISNFILKEYHHHELPWAHSTILNHHLRDLHMKHKITMTHDRLYQLSLSTTTKPPPTHPILNATSSSSSSPPCSNSPSSSSSSSSSSSHWSNPTSSSSSLEWGPPNTRKKKRKRNRKKGRGGTIRGRGRGRGKTRVRVRVRGRGRQSRKIHVTSDEDEDEVTGMEVEEDDGGEKQQNNEVMEEGVLVESQTKVVESQNIEVDSENVKEKGEIMGLRRSGRIRNVVNEEHNIRAKEEYHHQQQSDADVINGDGDEIDEHVESSKQEEEEKDTVNVEHKEEEEQETEVNQEPINPQEQDVEISNEQDLESCGQDLLKIESTEEQPQETEINQKESETVVVESNQQMHPLSGDENQEEEPNKDTEEQIKLQNEETVTSEPVNKVTAVILPLKKAESESESESQEDDDTDIEKIQPKKQLKVVTKKLPLREGLRSSCKKQKPTPKPKKQREHAPPVRRNLRSRKTNEEADIIIEGPDNSKEQVEYSGRTRSSKRLSKSSEVEQHGKTDLYVVNLKKLEKI
ncbi:hypothetical protein LXL04_025078 [Taraxacum kok-saghyz]